MYRPTTPSGPHGNPSALPPFGCTHFSYAAILLIFLCIIISFFSFLALAWTVDVFFGGFFSCRWSDASGKTVTLHVWAPWWRGGAGEVDVKSVFPGLVDASITGGVMVAAAAEIGWGLGWAFWRRLADALACLASAPFALVVFPLVWLCEAS